MLNSDYKDMLLLLLDEKVKFLVVGAYAVNAYGFHRATGDIDFWVEPSLINSKKILIALKKFGAPMKEVREDTFTKKGIIFQMGVAPNRIDIITMIDGVEFEDAYNERKIIELEKIKIPFLSKKHLIKNKSSTGRDKDKVDLKLLQAKRERKK